MQRQRSGNYGRHLGWLLCLTLVACGPSERVEVRTGSSVSGARGGDSNIRTYAMPIRERGGEGDTVETELELEIVGIIDSPEVDGVTLQATDVQWHGDNVMASYNVRGETFLGALQVIDASDPSQPVVLAEAIYYQTDLSNIRFSGTRIVAAGADEELGATLETFSLLDGELTFDGHIELGSFAGTYVELEGQRAMVTYGDQNGGIATFSLANGFPELVQRLELEDARWVSPLPGDNLLAVAGSPGRIVQFSGVLDEDNRQTDSVQVSGAHVGAPTWAQYRHDLLYLSSDDAGLLIYDVNDMSLVGTLATNGTANGSAVSLDGKLSFLANGEEGLVVADVLDPSDPRVLATIDILDDRGSANAVSLQQGYVALADGLGGVKLIRYERSVPGQDQDCDGDGLFDFEDPDDDDDGILDDEDDAPCNPDIVCDDDTVHQVSRFVGDFFNLPCDHPDVEGPITGIVTGTLPWDYDWFDEQYYVFTLERDNLLIEYAEDYFPVDTGLCDDPYYFAAHWTTTALATEEGTYTLGLASDDDGWLFVDDQLIIDLGGVHSLRTQTADVYLPAGAHHIDIYFAERHVVQSGLRFEVVDTPSQTARLELAQHSCLDPDGDEDGDGTSNEDDIAPLERP